MGFFAGLASLLKFVTAMRDLYEFFQKNADTQWFKELEETQAKARSAQTPEEKRDAVRSMARLLSRM